MRKILTTIYSYLQPAVVAIVAVLLLQTFVIVNATIPTGSMEPTIVVGSRSFFLRVPYYFSAPERGDIVVFRFPDDESQLYVKRVAALPGETIAVVDGKIYINDVLHESLSRFETDPTKDYGPYTVPEGGYFMLGDNRNRSQDSRYWKNTVVARNKILGRALIQYWPKIQLFENK